MQPMTQHWMQPKATLMLFNFFKEDCFGLYLMTNLIKKVASGYF